MRNLPLSYAIFVVFQARFRSSWVREIFKLLRLKYFVDLFIPYTRVGVLKYVSRFMVVTVEIRQIYVPKRVAYQKAP